MALERKGVRFKIDPDMHAALTALAEIAEIAGKDLGEMCEQIVCGEVEKRLHAATVLVERTKRLGISGQRRA